MDLNPNLKLETIDSWWYKRFSEDSLENSILRNMLSNHDYEFLQSLHDGYEGDREWTRQHQLGTANLNFVVSISDKAVQLTELDSFEFDDLQRLIAYYNSVINTENYKFSEVYVFEDQKRIMLEIKDEA